MSMTGRGRSRYVLALFLLVIHLWNEKGVCINAFIPVYFLTGGHVGRILHMTSTTNMSPNLGISHYRNSDFKVTSSFCLTMGTVMFDDEKLMKSHNEEIVNDKSKSSNFHNVLNHFCFPQKICNIIGRMVKPLSIAFISTTTLASPNICLSVDKSIIRSPMVHASLPVTPIAKFKAPNQKAEAFKKYRKELDDMKLKEVISHQIKCEEIESQHGIKARQKYEYQYETEELHQAEHKIQQRSQLQYRLIHHGMCPFSDVEGVRQIYLFDNDIDLNLIPTTPQNKEVIQMQRSPEFRDQRGNQRFIVKCIVDDVRMKGEDPLAYLEMNQEWMKDVYTMKAKQASVLAERYKSIIEVQGTLSGPSSKNPFDMDAAMGVKDVKSNMENTNTQASNRNIGSTTKREEA